MSRRGNCYDNAVAESFFHLLKTERIRRKTYKTRREARQGVFDYIEIFYNPKRRHADNGMLSPVEFEMAEKCSSKVSTKLGAHQGDEVTLHIATMTLSMNFLIGETYGRQCWKR